MELIRVMLVDDHPLLRQGLRRVIDDTADLELYDYVRDPGETKNLAAEEPKVVAQLRAKLAAYPEAKPAIKR